jgi:hypothetical protein
MRKRWALVQGVPVEPGTLMLVGCRVSCCGVTWEHAFDPAVPSAPASQTPTTRREGDSPATTSGSVPGAGHGTRPVHVTVIPTMPHLSVDMEPWAAAAMEMGQELVTTVRVSNMGQVGLCALPSLERTSVLQDMWRTNMAIVVGP